MSDLNEYDLAIVDAAQAWWSELAGIVDFSNMGPAAQHLAKAVQAERERFERAREFGPTPVEGSTYEDRLNVLEDRLNALDNQRIVGVEDEIHRLEEERIDLTVRVNQICSFLGPAFQEWRGR